MDSYQILNFIKEQVVERIRRPLTFVEEELIIQCLQRKKYDEMEDPFVGHSLGYIKTQVAPKLWCDLTQVFGHDVSKKNLRSIVERAMEKSQSIDVVGQIIKERYEVIQVINKEDSRRMFLVKDLHLNNDLCILKRIICSQNIKINQRKFMREINFLYQLGWHEQIPGYREHFEKNNSLYLVYKYVEGYSLNKKLPEDKNSETWQQEQVINFLLELLKVLEFVHKQNVIHRDIRPSNLIQSSNGKIYLINFGTIKNLVGLQNLTYEGTRGYSAPEQSHGRPRLNSDLYAVAMVGIQALTGIPPKNFQYDDKTIVWPKPSKIRQDLVEILDKMGHFHWQERYQSATEVIEDLKELRRSLAMNYS